MSRRRRKGEGRGRLSAIDMLPEIAGPDIQWAVDELIASQRPQTEILAEFNERLAAIGLGPISSSAFNRHSLRIAATTRRMKETQEVTRAITDRLGPDSGDQMTVGLAVLLKQAAWDLAEQGRLDPENVMFLSRSLQAVVGAQKTSADVRRAAQAEMQKKLDQAADAFEKVAGEKGFSAETVEAIKARILGVAS
ncbi:DUF3486 family protein [Jiella pacifica]|uniref:DUF3486 family protein n=1 Tax=Jiella pacifica TaxID=2696469 RepID=A0A6N9SY92_9HYPH|nr:DUF3486 family protein [Jiella pacifica]NDW04060.1 DUF3486 family protein [Jiella pacifica]